MCGDEWSQEDLNSNPDIKNTYVHFYFFFPFPTVETAIYMLCASLWLLFGTSS